jgi:hypothetical protein
MRRRGLPWLLAGFASILGHLPDTMADDGDSFIAGYAAAILEREFALTGVTLRVQKGVVFIHALDLLGRDRDKVVASLTRVRGVKGVRILDPDTPLPGEADPPAAPPPPVSGGGWQFLPDNRIFSPLLADPRWPHFSVSYGYVNRRGLPRVRHLGLISLGEHVTFVEYDSEGAGRFGAGLQPGVHGIFDLNAPSKDLVNADYRLGVPVDYRYEGFSMEAAVFHQSSHLGDEFVFQVQTPRLNLSYEAVTLKLSQDIGPARLVAGFGRLVHSQPANLSPWWAMQGLEWTPALPCCNESLAMVLAVQAEEHQKTDWHVDVSVRAGVEFVNPGRTRRRFQILLEYYRGQDPNGQFFLERIETFGLGIHLYF